MPETGASTNPITPAWRNLVDQLTPKQVADLEHAEQRFIAEGVMFHPQGPQMLYRDACEYVSTNAVEKLYADVPVPEGAVADSEGWMRSTDTGDYWRSLRWRNYETGVEGLDVLIEGRQETDGSFTRQLSVWAEHGVDLPGPQARSVAALLLAAADELERLS